MKNKIIAGALAVLALAALLLVWFVLFLIADNATLEHWKMLWAAFLMVVAAGVAWLLLKGFYDRILEWLEPSEFDKEWDRMQERLKK